MCSSTLQAYTCIHGPSMHVNLVRASAPAHSVSAAPRRHGSNTWVLWLAFPVSAYAKSGSKNIITVLLCSGSSTMVVVSKEKGVPRAMVKLSGTLEMFLQVTTEDYAACKTQSTAGMMAGKVSTTPYTGKKWVLACTLVPLPSCTHMLLKATYLMCNGFCMGCAGCPCLCR